MQYLKMATLAKNGVRIQCYWRSYLEPTLTIIIASRHNGTITYRLQKAYTVPKGWMYFYSRLINLKSTPMTSQKMRGLVFTYYPKIA